MGDVILVADVAKRIWLEQEHDADPQPCPNCHRMADSVKRRHMTTCYHDEESNYITCCLECFEAVEEYWRERWEEYYSEIR